MPEDHIRYDLLAQNALRGVVRTVLLDAAEKGLPGEHYFEIVFATAALGVQLSERMRAQYPQAMKIVLQHQFWDLTVADDKFEVGLSFGGIAERVAVPFDAMMAFYDPTAQFALEFVVPGMQAPGEVTEAKSQDRSAGAETQRAAEKNERNASPEPDAKREPPESGAEVVSLDRFRKK